MSQHYEGIILIFWGHITKAVEILMSYEILVFLYMGLHFSFISILIVIISLRCLVEKVKYSTKYDWLPSMEV